MNQVTDFPLSTAQHDPIAVARELAESFRTSAVERDRKGGNAKAERDQIRASGLLGIWVPKQFGGGDADLPTILAVIKEIAKADGSLGHIFGYHFSCQTMVELFGSEAQQEKFYRGVVNQHWFVGNASSENNNHVLDWRVSASPTDDGGYIFNGTKHFCSGSVDSDQLLVFGVIQDDPERLGSVVAALIPTRREGVQVNEDWNAIGMRQTDSGSTVFTNVRVHPDEVLGVANAIVEAFVTGNRGSLWTPVTQLIFSFLYLGIAEGALAEALEYTRTQSRPWTPAGVQSVTADPYIIARYAEFAVQLQAANAAAREAAQALQKAWDLGDAITPAQRGELMVQVSGVKVLATRVALDITSGVFETMGARSTQAKYGFDRYWRNVRTHTLHDPVSYKLHDVGNHALNGAFPVPGFTS
ncbi:MAG: acyl-CoA dehydrogenase family protein [Rugosibacter sp.]|nr:acyl-CoA dehydrogenase family protein [Rugosibacter sp.]